MFAATLRPARPHPAPRALALWLLFIAALVLVMVAVGGITRLTESGLSITEWKPVSGTLPPLTHAAWMDAFGKYQATPQYRLLNRGMSLGQFQNIFFWEYVHRVLARVIVGGLVILLAVAWWRRLIPKRYGSHFVALVIIGALQAVIGWWMVVSGLQSRTEVSHVRLAIHLLAGLLLFSVILWTALDLRRLANDPGARPSRLRAAPALVLAMLAVQLMLGAFTAGLRAGYAFSSWPKMGDEWFPSATPILAPGWTNLVDNPIVVQFAHRWWAWIVAVAALWLAFRARGAGFREAPALVGGLLALQIALGITTLLTGVLLPVAVAHQAVAVLLLASLVLVAHRLGTTRAASVARPARRLVRA